MLSNNSPLPAPYYAAQILDETPQRIVRPRSAVDVHLPHDILGILDASEDGCAARGVNFLYQ